MPQSHYTDLLLKTKYAKKVFGLPAESNNTDIHDITLSDENISVKTVGGNTILWRY